MATYSSYKKIIQDQVPTNIVSDAKVQDGAVMNRGVQWVFSARGMCCHHCANNSGCVCQACGRCCLWTVPSRVSTVTFEIWSGGGGGAGNTCCDCWYRAMGGAGGNYAIQTIETKPGCQYRVCAGGSWPCSKSHTCTAGMGCKSYVTGYNLSNFCVVGGCGAHGCVEGDEWGQRHQKNCANCGICGIYGADFGSMGTTGNLMGSSMCYCHGRVSFTGAAPFIGKSMSTGMSGFSCCCCHTCSCGCYVNWPAGGGSSGEAVNCGHRDSSPCCAGGVGQGGSGIVKITYA
jgi:hypothetical protein